VVVQAKELALLSSYPSLSLEYIVQGNRPVYVAHCTSADFVKM